jgi:hypothetical protein
MRGYFEGGLAEVIPGVSRGAVQQQHFRAAAVVQEGCVVKARAPFSITLAQFGAVLEQQLDSREAVRPHRLHAAHT